MITPAPDSPSQLENHLRNEVEIATIHFEAAKREFWRVSENEHEPKHSATIADAANSLDKSRAQLSRALQRFTAYLADGTVPDVTQASLNLK